MTLGNVQCQTGIYQETIHNKISTVIIFMRTLEILSILELELLNAKHFLKMEPPNLGTVNIKLKQKTGKDQCKGVNTFSNKKKLVNL